MAVLTLATRNDIGDFRYRVTLDDEIYELRFLYNRREEAWYLDVLDVEGLPLRMGLKLVVSWVIMSRLADPRGWPGDFILIDTTGEDVDPVLEDLGARVQVQYREVDT